MLFGLKGRRLQRLKRRRLKCPNCGKYNWNEASRCEHCDNTIDEHAREALQRDGGSRLHLLKMASFWLVIFLLLVWLLGVLG